MEWKSGDFTLIHEEKWGMDLPSYEDHEWGMRKIVDIGVDPFDRVYLLTRSSRPIIVTDGEGRYLTHWNNTEFKRPHSISFTEEGCIYIVDDDCHCVTKYDINGKMIYRLGDPDNPAETGCVHKDYRTVRYSAGPFCYPTGVSITEDGEIYVSDGYGNARIHRFDATGGLIQSWGEPGVLPGQFFLPHGVYVREDTVFVADRENNRVQLFDREGTFKEEWPGFIRPTAIRYDPRGFLYVTEAKRCDVFDAVPSALCIVSLEGKRLAEFDNRRGCYLGATYHTAHGLGMGNAGEIYIGEVGAPPEDFLGVKKYWVNC